MTRGHQTPKQSATSVDSVDVVPKDRTSNGRGLTRGDKVLAWSMVLGTAVIPVCGFAMILAGSGALRVVGIVVVVVGLLVAATPISPVLHARVRRRDRSNDPNR
jgi:hypothetical protein